MTFDIVPARIEYSTTGALPTTFVPGSFLLTHGTSVVSSLIRTGQHLRFPAYRKTWDDYNHAVGVTDTKGSTVEMLSRGAVAGTAEKYREQKFHLVVPRMTPEQGKIAADFWLWSAQKGVRYNWTAAVSDGVTCLLGASLEFGTKGRMICSGMVAAGLVRAGLEGTEIWTADPSHVFPTELGIAFGVAPLALKRTS